MNREITYPLSIDCLWKVKALSYTMRATCGATDCGHSKLLDLDALIDRLGEEYPIPDGGRLESSIRCEKCGHRGGIVTHGGSGPRPYGNKPGF